MSRPVPRWGVSRDPTITLDHLLGRFDRSSITLPDGSIDAATTVGWLQGPSRHVDLRQPPARPGFTGIRGIADLEDHHLDWLERQEGFAGRTSLHDGRCTWKRLVDLRPPTGTADEGWLRWDGPTLVEEGCHEPYVERWERSPGATDPAAAVELADTAGGVVGLLVRVGVGFGWARGPAATPGVHDLDRRRAGVDREVAMGAVEGARWTIERSSLPFRQGADLAPRWAGEDLVTRDVSRTGAPGERRWSVTASEGDVQHLAAPTAG